LFPIPSTLPTSYYSACRAKMAYLLKIWNPTTLQCYHQCYGRNDTISQQN